jgi:hypothetical protein
MRPASQRAGGQGRRQRDAGAPAMPLICKSMLPAARAVTRGAGRRWYQRRGWWAGSCWAGRAYAQLHPRSGFRLSLLQQYSGAKLPTRLRSSVLGA